MDLPVETILREHASLREIPDAYVGVLVSCVTSRRFGSGEYLFRLGDPARRFFLIRSGTVSIEYPVPGRAPDPIQTLSEGDLVGWSWLLEPHTRHFDARALDEVRTLCFDGDRLLGHASRDHEFGYHVLRQFAGVVTRRLRATQLQLLDLHRKRHGSGPDSA